jgi:hypothetical protein
VARLTDLVLQRLDPVAFVRRQAGRLLLVALGLANPTAKRLGIAADLARNRRNRGPLRGLLSLVIKHRPHRSLAHLR